MNNTDIDLCGAGQMLQQLLRMGKITRKEASKIVRCLAALGNSSFIVSL